MRTFENADGAFVEIFAEGLHLHRRWGRANHSALTGITTFPTVARAARAFTQQVRRLEHHYQPGAVQEAMLEAMRTAPKDPAPFLVYADWLQQFGDPHGALITHTQTRCELQSLVGEDVPHWFPNRHEHGKFFWELGFIVRAQIPGASPAAIREVLAHPSLMFVRELALTESPCSWILVDDWRRFFEAEMPATLERIEVPKNGPLAPLALKLPSIVAT